LSNSWQQTQNTDQKHDRAITDIPQPLDSRTLSRLEAAIHKSDYVANGQKLKVVPKVNPEIRGGLIVEIGDRTIDLSVSAKMAKMNKLLKDTL
jgi:F-type H+-transporting ATPase subunit O